MARSGIADVDKMGGTQFEHFLANIYRKQGYKVKVTPPSGDYGADLVIEKNNVRIVVQAKRHKKNVGIKAVQEVIGAKSHYQAQEGWVVTNSNYTEAAVNLARSNGIRLVRRKELVEMMIAVKAGTTAPDATVRNQITATRERQISTLNTAQRVRGENVVCNKCGNTMVLRKSSLGTAYICKSYPDCKGIKYI